MTDTTPDRSVAFVADGQIEQRPPPRGETGPLHWVRENLFPDALNSVLTVLSILFLVWLVPSVWTWAVSHSVLSANSLDECRQIVNATFGEDAHGACWAVVGERFNQFMFGFYPSELYWRPVLAGALLLVALAPVLFTGLPGRGALLIFTAAYPVVAYFLLWGGSVVPFLTFLVAIGIGYAVFRAMRGLGHPVLSTIGLAAAGAAVLGYLYLHFLWGPLTGAIHSVVGEIGPEAVGSDQFGGFLLTLIIGVTAITFSLPIGIVLALGRQSSLVFIRMVSVVFIEFIRGVPLITLLFVASTLLNYFLPPGTTFDIILRVVIMVTLFAAAYIAEAVRGGLAALPKGQYEAADAMGLTYWQSMRLIILPQALKISVPSIVNIFIGVFKDSTLVSIIGLLDPLGIIQPILADSRWQGIVAELYIFVAVLFFFCCFGMSRYSMYLERKLKTDRS